MIAGSRLRRPTDRFPNPPARQATTSRLAGNPFPVAARQASVQSRFDLPLTAWFRRRSATIGAVCVVLAFAALAGFVVPFLLGR